MAKISITLKAYTFLNKTGNACKIMIKPCLSKLLSFILSCLHKEPSTSINLYLQQTNKGNVTAG